MRLRVGEEPAATDRTALVFEELSSHRLELGAEPEAVAVGVAVDDELWLNERRLERRADGSFHLSLGASAGSFRLERRRAGRPVEAVAVVVLPRAAKLDAREWLELLEELDAWLPGVTEGDSGARHGSVTGGDGRVEAGAVALLELVQPLLGATRALLAAPRIRERGTWLDLPMNTIRRVEPETVRWLARTPVATAALQGTVAALGERPPDVPQFVLEPALDHPANQFVAWLLRQVALRLEALETRLAPRGRRGGTIEAELDPRRVDEAAWRAARCQAAREGSLAVRRLVRRSFLGRLQHARPTEAALLTMQDDPRYARVHRLCRPFLSPRFRPASGRDADEVPIRPSFEIYELWTFLALGRWLRERLPAAERWSERGMQRLCEGHGTGASLVGTLPGGALTLWFNPVFPSYFARAPDSARYSLSSERRPDLVLTWTPASAEGRWICLDAKYRVGDSMIGDALASAHLYRDSLVWEGHGGRCQAAWLLVPKLDDGTRRWSNPAFEARFGFGVAALAPRSPRDEGLFTRMLERLGLDAG